MDIKVDDLSGPEVTALIAEHLKGMFETTPPESVHALNLDGLKKPDITFWSAWEQGDLVGCGALKELDKENGELKSMRTASAHLRKGVAGYMLAHIIGEAKLRGYRRLSLETGSTEDFKPAVSLYEKYGFQYCGPFADYTDDPYSLYMTMEL
ncbi:GNAT family N-acetyltransferase [Gorillibacterium massiliense]|uniref:GNAT family N-acetyltransferase n=1 Tax=Gorillibacterium massiliense TaxID=1280390 RepID=UPI0004AEACFE|nr:GNAT family N-acetyltransferase [Gorillibacterium massiliense]